MKAHAGYNQAHPEWLGFDCLSYILPGTSVGAITTADLDGILESYEHTLFNPKDYLIQRRSSWLCQSPQAQPFLTHWLNVRDANKKMWSDIRQFGTFEAVADWLLLSRDGMEALRSSDGFTEIARFGTAHA